jgi:asparagine synthase (glutamine-hydrolysing)
MCGITGAIWNDPRLAVDRATLQKMTQVLRHRGPDDEGTHTSTWQETSPGNSATHVALGHRRLAILDLSGSRQPLSNEDESIWLVFNGEIYNYRDLRNRLEGSGHRFRSQGDSETIVHLYEDEGLDFVNHLVGMFALALWDGRRQRLVLARDRLGQKPLVYLSQPGRLLFASELKSLLAVPNVPRQIDVSSLDEYLTYQYVPHPNTIFRGIRKLPPGHLAVYESDKLTVSRYWSPDFGREVIRSRDEYVERLRTDLRSAVALRMQSDVPLGAFLSGGVDSSIIVALMQQLAGGPVKTFSIGFSVPEYDESQHARKVAEYLGTEHHEFRVEPDGLDILPKLVWHYDEPFADSSAVPTYCVAELTRQHVTVALTGDGGDELFLGYPRYRAVQLAGWFDRLPWPLPRMLASRWWQKLPASARQKGLVRRWRRFTAAMAMPPVRRYLDWIAIFGEARRGQLYSDDLLAALPESDPAGFLEEAFARAAPRDGVTAASLADLVTYLPCDLMTKVDIASMANGLECRQPLLDHRVVELAIGMPRSLKYHGRQSKWILQQAFGDLLPAAVFRRKKMGFGVPIDHWFRHELRDFAHEVLLDPSTLARGYFRREAVAQLLDEHTRGIFDHAYRLWSLLVLELWLRQWADPA